jgi:hypothetical protein
MPFDRREEEEDPTFDEVSAMADRLGLKGKGRMTYIDDHMMQLGYEPIQSRESYVRRQEEAEADEGGSAGRWGFGGGGRGGGRGGNPRGGRGAEDDSF